MEKDYLAPSALFVWKIANKLAILNQSEYIELPHLYLAILSALDGIYWIDNSEVDNYSEAQSEIIQVKQDALAILNLNEKGLTRLRRQLIRQISLDESIIDELPLHRSSLTLDIFRKALIFKDQIDTLAGINIVDLLREIDGKDVENLIKDNFPPFKVTLVPSSGSYTDLTSQPSGIETSPEEDNDDPMVELQSLIGLGTVKKEVNQLVNFLKVQQIRQSKGLAAQPISRHLVFLGNPGTGKTTVARLIARIYRSLGILRKGHLIETDRSGLVAGYIGQTALKVASVVNSAIGGVLFIDEAYSLSAGDNRDFGNEAIEVLIKMMEDHRDDLVVVVAGYTDKMNSFIESNPGIRSRFNKFLTFSDYIPNELLAIFELFCQRGGYHLSTQAKVKMENKFTSLYTQRNNTFGNGRLARNLFEDTISNQANRIVNKPDATKEELSTIEVDDIPSE